VFLLRHELQGYIEEKRKLENICEKCDHKDNCVHCSSSKLLRLIEGDIKYTEHEISEVEWDVDTWAYTITGNKEARRLSYELTGIMMNYATPEEKKQYTARYPNKLWRKFLEIGFDEIIEWVFEQGSRLAFQILGEEIMYNGAKMPEEIRELILLYSEWEDEEDQLKDEKDRLERKYFLLDFREKVKYYKEGVPINIPRKTQREMFENQTRDKDGFISIDRQPIDYCVFRKTNYK